MTPSPTIQEQTTPEQPVAAQTIHPDYFDRLDKDFIDYYETYLAKSRPAASLSIEQTRALRSRFHKRTVRDYSNAPCVQDLRLKSKDGYVFTVRLYKPDPRTSPFGAGPYPVHVNFHGGGFTFGDLNTDASICMRIRSRLGILVADVDYRLRPEHSQGKGHDDCWAAVQWIYSYAPSINARANSFSIGGISAGGGITATVQQLARDAGIPLTLATLGVPTVVTHSHYEKASDSEFPSFVENEFAPCLNWGRIQFFKANASRFEEAEDDRGGALPEIYVSPLHGDLEGCCPTFIGTASVDPLRDEGEAYGQKLVAAGVRTTVRRYMGVPHPFMHFPIAKAAMYLDDLCEALRAAHAVGFPRGNGGPHTYQQQSNANVARRRKIFQAVMPRRPAGAAANGGAAAAAMAGASPTSPTRRGISRSFTWSSGRLGLATREQGKRKQFQFR